MIARIIIPIVLLITLSDVYICLHLLRGQKRWRIAKQVLWWAQYAVFVVYSIALALSRDFAPADTGLLNLYLLFLGVWLVPKTVFAICSLLGWGHCLYHKTKTNWGNPVGLFFGLILAVVTVYGSTIGFSEIKVRHVTFCSPDLPAAFNGYRILQFSDAHVGTYGSSRLNILNNAVDTMLKQNANLIVFTGDLQNIRPSEIEKVKPLLSRLNAPDGVVSVLGNHDYAEYVKCSNSERQEYERQTRNMQTSMGWQLLLNGNMKIRRGADSIVVAGMENDGKRPFPQRGDALKAMLGVGEHAFTVMLEHDPTAWRRKILPQTSAQLTLSGHTHAAQFMLFGWSPSSLVYDEWGGMYYEGNRAINVSTGLGGFVPFRFGCPSEVVVITLVKGKRSGNA